MRELAPEAVPSVPVASAVPAAGRAEPLLAALYREHFHFVWRSLRRLGVPESGVDDAVQEVFLIAHRKLHEFEGRSTHRVWLFAIGLRVAREFRRRDRRLQLDEQTVNAAASLDRDTLELRRRVQLLDALTESLSDEQREVFVMSEIEGFSAPEIALALDVKLNTVYSRLRLGRWRFSRALARHIHQQKREVST